MDKQTAGIVSPLFIPAGGAMTFRVGGGVSDAVYVALCAADGNEMEFARGDNKQVMLNAAWDMGPYIGQKMFIKIDYKSQTGWGHITVDDFQFVARVLSESPNLP